MRRPKYRKEIFEQGEIRERAEHLIKKICEEYGIEMNETEVANDHMHMVVPFPEKPSIEEMIRIIKSISARALFRKFPRIKHGLWSGELRQDGYSARTAGERMTRQSTDKYIQRHYDSEQGPMQFF